MNPALTSGMQTSSIHSGFVFHQRTTPSIHSFTYPLFLARISVDELERLDLSGRRIFSHNRYGLFSLYDRDYLAHYEGSLREKVEKTLENHKVEEIPSRIDLISHPRIFGYAFNPVSFFLCYRLDKSLCAVIAEVHNTFGEVHIYVLGENEKRDRPGTSHSFFECKKEFHVSPFFDRSGVYYFSISRDDSGIDIRVSLMHDDKLVFTSSLKSDSTKPWKLTTLLGKSVTYPGSILLTMPRIIYQAAQLKWRRRLRVYTRPIAIHPMTIERQGPGVLQKISLMFFEKFLSNTKYGSISFRYSPEEVHAINGSEEGRHAVLDVHNYDLFLRSLIGGDVGFGESYVEGDWSSDNLLEVLQFFCENQKELNDRMIGMSYPGRIKNFLSHIRRKNTIKKSSSNIQAHYDLSNDLFSSFLDSHMQYSSAIFLNPEEDLDSAQLNKMNLLIERAQLSKEDHVLEIGCGWGGFAIHMAKTLGCKVTGITLSDEQKKYAEERIRHEGLESLIEIQKIDYRSITGRYSKIISVEMIEAVGFEFIETFFKCCNELLGKNGLLVLQAITMPEQRYDAYRKGCDWIQKYVFPGGHCPSIEKLVSSAKKSSSFVLESTEDIGLHYAKTLSVWRDRFNRDWDTISELGFDDRFKRIWNYYLAYCEAGFSTKMIYTHQMVFAKS